MKYLLKLKTISTFGTTIDYSIEHIEPKESKYGESWYNNCVKDLSEKLYRYLRFNPSPYNLSKEDLKQRIESFVQSGEVTARLAASSTIHSIQRDFKMNNQSGEFGDFILINLSQTGNTIDGPIVTRELYEKIQSFSKDNDIYAVQQVAADCVNIKLKNSKTFKMTEKETTELDLSVYFVAWSSITTFESFMNFQKLIRGNGVSYMHKVEGGYYCFDDPDTHGYDVWIFNSNLDKFVTDINGDRLITLKDAASHKLKMIREEDFYLLRLQ